MAHSTHVELQEVDEYMYTTRTGRKQQKYFTVCSCGDWKANGPGLSLAEKVDWLLHVVESMQEADENGN